MPDAKEELYASIVQLMEGRRLDDIIAVSAYVLAEAVAESTNLQFSKPDFYAALSLYTSAYKELTSEDQSAPPGANIH